MAGTGFNPTVNQGQLNRVLVSAIFPNDPQLSVTAPYMAKGMCVLTFDDDAVDQINTATGLVNSPNVWVKTTLEVNILRTQPVAGYWITQYQTQCTLGNVTVYPDVSTGWPALTMQDASIITIVPGPYDGTDPTVKVTVKGAFPINSFLWAGA